MPAVTLVIDRDTGKLEGMTEKDRKGWGRFLNKVKSLADSCITFEWREPRSGPYHRFCFAAWSKVFDAQERFDDFDEFVCWVKVGGGHCHFIPHAERGLVAIPKSINWASLDEVEFRNVANGMFDFLRSEHARRTMWPHLCEGDSFEMVEIALQGFQ